MLKRWLPILTLSVCAAIPVPSAPAAVPDATLVSRIGEALRIPGIGPAMEVRSAALADGALSVDFAPPAGEFTDADLEALTDAVRAAAPPSVTEFLLAADGRPLASYLPPVPDVSPAADIRPRRTPISGSLSGKKIVLSPGHGWTYYGTPTTWQLQRVYFYGIVEDFVNHEIIQNLYNLLVNNGAVVYVTREMDKSYPDCNVPLTFAGSTRPAPYKPWWQMAALYHARRMGAPSSVYDNGRSNDYNRDIVARPLYANALGADIMVSLHNNGYNGTATGTETLYDTGNGQTVTDSANQFGSQYLAQKIQNRVVSTLRSRYYSAWTDRGAKGFAGSYGENREAKMPACLIEVAFMDRQNPDNNALQDENFKMLVAKAMYEGICDYFHVTPSYNTNVMVQGQTFTATPWPKRWQLKLDAPVNAPPSSAGGWVYAGTDGGAVYGVAAVPSAGTPLGLRWRYPAAGGLGAPVRARPTAYEDRVFAVAANGSLVALDRITGQRLWSATVPNAGNVTASPAATVDGSLVVASDNGRLYAYRQADGAPIGATPFLFGPIRAQVAIPDSGHVWVTSEDGRVRCMSGDLKTVLWETNSGAPVRTAPFVLTANNAVYVTTSDRSLVALNASNGGPAQGWTEAGARFGTDILTSPWADAASGLVAFGTAAHTIMAADPAGPVVPPDFPMRPAGTKAFTSDPVVFGNTVYVGGTDGKVYALRRVAEGTDPGPADWRVFDAAREPLPGPFNAAVCLTGTDPDTDLVVAGNGNGYLYGLPLQ